jgi:hypothetical protein
MKKMILPVLAVVIFTSCAKSPNETPPIDPNKSYTIRYNTADQVAKTRVVNDTLRIDLYQKINFLLDPTEATYTWSLDLIQDFSKSYLKDLHFDAVANSAGYAHDWVPIDLNTVAPGQKTISTVTVDGKKYTQVTLNRVFEFYNKMGTHQAALNQQSALLQTNTDVVVYKAFYAYNNIYSLSSDASFKIVYTNTP